MGTFLAEGLFYGAAAVLLVSALGVVLSRNSIYSALWLVLSLLATAALYAMLQAHFLAVVQIMVYAGAIMVLIVFVLMLLGAKRESFRWEAAWLGAAALGAGLSLLGVLAPLLLGESSGAVAGSGVGAVASIGQALYGRYVFPFEAASLLIVAAMVGAVMLGRRRPPGGGGEG
jgi:NADH-quinone oxidoreductase subunit J